MGKKKKKKKKEEEREREKRKGKKRFLRMAIFCVESEERK